MRSQTIRKRLQFMPNLENYDEACKNFSWKHAEREIEFFSGRKMNAAYNAIDRHAKTWRKNKIALYWEGESIEKGRQPVNESRKYTFQEMSFLSNKFANVLKKHGIKKGDKVFIFLPRIPELYISFLGILKTGAIAGTLFSAFQEKALQDRLEDSGAKILITNNELKRRVYKIWKNLPKLKKIIVVDENKSAKKELSYWEEMNKATGKFNAAKMHPNDFAFMLYTSGTTGKPKGVLHRHYAIVQEHMTAKWVLDLKDSDVYWCSADPGWVTGVAYSILGSWSNGASAVVYSGRFDAAKWYSIIEKYKVNVWYTAPTAIRMLASAGDIYKKYDLTSLRHMCSVGEPLNPEPIYWGMKAFKLPFHDNWWQTETGGILIANYPCMPIKPGSMGKPFPGIRAAIIDDKGKELSAGKEGNLAMIHPWPSIMKEIWKNKKKYKSYFLKKWYISGDRVYRDSDGYFWFVGRADDVIKTSGERVGPFEVESSIIEVPGVVEAGVIGKPDAVRGEIIKAFVVLKKGIKPSEALKKQIQEHVKKHLAGHAYPREIEFVQSLPKTQSGKIVRRMLKAKELGQPAGDTSTLEKF